MGIKGEFRQTLMRDYPAAFDIVQLSYFSGQSVAVDVSGMLFFYKMVHGDAWLERMREFFCEQINQDVDLIVIFDGKAPKEKLGEQKRRLESRQQLRDKADKFKQAVELLEQCESINQISLDIVEMYRKLSAPSKIDSIFLKELLGEAGEDYQVVVEHKNTILNMRLAISNKLQEILRELDVPTREDMISVEELCDQLGLIWARANGEADPVCAWLSSRGHVEAVISEDSDMIPLGCETVLSRVRKGGKDSIKKTNGEWNWIRMRLDRLLSAAELSLPQLVDWAILCGTDFNKNIFRIGVVKALKLVKEYKTIENVGESGTNVAALCPWGLEPGAESDPVFYKTVRGLFDVSELDQCPLCVSLSQKILCGPAREARIKERRETLAGRWGQGHQITSKRQKKC